MRIVEDNSNEIWSDKVKERISILNTRKAVMSWGVEVTETTECSMALNTKNSDEPRWANIDI